MSICRDIRETLLSMADEKYKAFSSSLMPTVPKDKVIGVRIPLVRKYAKTLEGYDEFLADLPHKYFEEDNLHAFLLERESDFDTCIAKLDAFLPRVDNWATCDSMKPKVLKKEPAKLLVHIKEWLNSEEVYRVRYAINLLMSFYLDDNFNPDFLKLVAGVSSNEYYINMMRAWYFATALAKQYNHALTVIESGALDLWTHNKTIQKAVESFRITDEAKAYLKTLKK